MRLSPNMIGNFDDETNFPHKLFLTNRQVANLQNVFVNNTSTKLSNTQPFKMIQLGGSLGRLLKTGLPKMKNVIKPLATNVLIPLGLTVQHQQQRLEYIKNLRIWNNNTNNIK